MTPRIGDLDDLTPARAQEMLDWFACHSDGDRARCFYVLGLELLMALRAIAARPPAGTPEAAREAHEYWIMKGT